MVSIDHNSRNVLFQSRVRCQVRILVRITKERVHLTKDFNKLDMSICVSPIGVLCYLEKLKHRMSNPHAVLYFIISLKLKLWWSLGR